MASRKGWGTEDLLEQLANEYLKKHAANPLDITQQEWLEAHTFDERRLKKYYEDITNYNPNLAHSMFKGIARDWDVQNLNRHFKGGSRPYSRPITTLDIETDDLGRPITISAIKTAFNKATGKLELIDTFQRYYKSLDRNLRNTVATHGLTHRLLNKLRRQQGADYGWTYTNRERTALERFIRNDIVVGHNIQAFDIPHLFNNQHVSNQVVDTLIAARNIWGDTGRNSLDQVFKRVFGKSMEDMGLPHHESMSDTIATAMIYEAMSRSNTATGIALRTLLKHGDLNLVPLDVNLNSQLVQAPYWKYKEAKYYIDALGFTGVGHMKKELSEEDILTSSIGTSMHKEGVVNPDTIDGGDLGLYITSLSQSISNLSDMLGVIKESAVNVSGFGSALATYKRADYMRTLASVPPSRMQEVARGLNIPEADEWDMILAAQAIRQSRDFKSQYNELRHYIRSGWGNEDFVRKFRKELSYNEAWDWTKVEELERDQAEADFHNYKRNYEYARGRYSKGLLTQKQFDSLNLTSSYEDLTEATDKLVSSNQRLLNIYEAIGRIKIYDPNQYLNSARGQWQSIMGASSGVIPDFIRRPIGRIGSAFFNYQDRALTPYNRFMSAWNSGIGDVVGLGGASLGMAIGAPFGPLGMAIGAGAGSALKGLIGGTSQIWGNVSQGQMEVKGYQLQNTLNTLGAIIDWVSTPFKILGKVTKILIGNFSGLSIGIKRLMTGGLGDMSGMGNPLTDLTGIGYAAYQGTTALDRFSLLGKGTMNSVYENFAKQQRALYTLGELNTNRVVGASLLGVFPEVYTPTTNAEGAYNTMANKILATMKTQTEEQRATTMYLASLIDSSLPAVLNTARLMGVNDVSVLSHPQDWGMFWHPLGKGEEMSFRRSQFQYGIATEQFGVSKMRIADKLWNAVGRDLYNGFNRIVDAIVTGHWDTAISEVVDTWTAFKEKISGLWQAINKEITGEEGGSVTHSIVAAFKKLGNSLLIEGIKLVPKVLSIWDTLVLGIIDKMQGLIAYLSTISLEPTFQNGKLGFKIHSIEDATKIDESARALQYVKNRNTGGWKVLTPRSQTFKNIWEQVYPDSKRSNYSIGDVREALYALAENNATDLKTGVNPRDIVVPGLGLFAPTSKEQADKLMDMILKRYYDDINSQYGTDMSAAAAMFGYRGGYYDSFSRDDVYDKTGIFASMEEGIQSIENEVKNVVAGMINPLGEKQKVSVDLNFTAQGKKAGKISVDGATTNIAGDFRALADVLAEGAAFVSAQSY